MRCAILLMTLLLSSCGFYSFSGSSIPAGMKTIEIPLFENTALIQGVAEDITDAITRAMEQEKLQIVPRDGDAIITGTITRYRHEADDYSGNREDLSIKTYAVDIVCSVVFMDTNAEKALFEGTLTGKGIYDFDQESEAIGRKRAVEDLTQKIVINSLQGW